MIEAIQKRTSVRAFEDRPVDEKTLSEILKAGNLAPVYGSFLITVIEDEKVMDEIRSATVSFMKNAEEEFLRKAAEQEGFDPLYGAPVFIVLSSEGGNDPAGFNVENVSLAAENMILEAAAAGLGTCFVMGPVIPLQNAEMEKKLGLPKGYVPLAGVVLGYPKEALQENRRKIPDNITYLK